MVLQQSLGDLAQVGRGLDVAVLEQLTSAEPRPVGRDLAARMLAEARERIGR